MRPNAVAYIVVALGLQINGLGAGSFKTRLTDALGSDASNFVSGHTLYVDSGVTATL